MPSIFETQSHILAEIINDLLIGFPINNIISHIPALMAAMVGSALAHGPAWEMARLLVDSGSEHPPLISQTLADRLGLQGPVAGGATQANGAFLPLRDVGHVEMLLNGQAVSENFLSALLSHYDVVLGEPWMRQNSIVMDYAHNVLWQWSHGVLKAVTFDVPLRSDPQAIAPDLQAQAHFHAQATRAVMLASAVTTGLRPATMSPVARQLETMQEDMERDRIRAI